MTAALKIQSRVCTENTLYSIGYTNISLVGCQDLSPRARRYLHFLVSIVKCGYTSIVATAGAISDAVYRAQGQTQSVRTLRYALSELETKGYISRPRNRGASHFKTVININEERFVFWTKKKEKNVIPIPTPGHNSGYVQDLQADDRRNNSACLNSQDSYISDNKEQHACTRSKPYANFKFHPIIFTLRILLWGKPDMGRVLSRANREIAGYSSDTGINWPHWSSIWQSMPKEEREGIAKVDFLPRLRDNSKSPISSPVSLSTKQIQTSTPDQGAREGPTNPMEGPIMDHIRDIILKTQPIEEEPPVKKPPPREVDIEEMKLDEEELRVLTGAKKAAENRR